MNHHAERLREVAQTMQEQKAAVINEAELRAAADEIERLLKVVKLAQGHGCGARMSKPGEYSIICGGMDQGMHSPDRCGECKALSEEFKIGRR